MTDWRVIQGSVVHADIAPYIALLVDETRATINSIYRGEDAAGLLHRHGKETQAEIHRRLPGISNPPGRSTHELRGDGVSYRTRVGARLPWWCQGFDVNDGDVYHLIAAARRHGWSLFQPYTRGVEFHHLNFKRRPQARGRDRIRIALLRHKLARR